MKYVVIVCRILLGAGFALSGFNILHPLGKMPAMDPSLPSTQWSMIMMHSGWMYVIGASQLLGGLLLLLRGTVPLGLCVLAPVLVNILCFHAFLTGGHNILPGVIFTLLWSVLLYMYRASFAGILTTKAAPTI